MAANTLYRFCSKLVTSTFQAGACGLKSNKDGLNEYGMLIKGDYSGIHFPVTFKQEYGKKLTDILDTGWTSLYLISDRMKIILEENKLTGWKTYPIKLYDKQNNEIFGYYGFSVTGRCDPIDYSKSEIIEKRRVSEGPLVKFYKGMYIDLAKWDGSDFFSPKNSDGLMITKKAADALTKNKISNLRLTNLVDVEVNLSIFQLN